MGKRTFRKESYFIGGKMKFRRVYIIDGIPADEFYEKNATDLDFFRNGDYHLMRSGNVSNHDNMLPNDIEAELDDDLEDLPF